jgi:Cytidylate kinase-like family
MPIILISSLPHGFGRELARELERKTVWPLFNREQLADMAHGQGFKLSRLEASIIKSPVFPEKLAREKELYLAFVTAKLYENATEGNLIYYGRAGHLLLPGVSHRLRVGLGVPRQIRVNNVVQDLRLSPEKAMEYLDQLDEDIEKWIHFVHRQDAKDPGQYDIFFNLQNMSLANAAVLLCETAELPDFRPTPISTKRLDDLYLAARAKLRLAEDEHTRSLDLGVRAVGGVVTVTYRPRQEEAAQSISHVLQGLEGCRENLCTMAETSILWIQEAFDSKTESFKQITRLAQRWGAAVELLRLAPHDNNMASVPPVDLQAQEDTRRRRPTDEVYTGGVEDDDTENFVDDGGLAATQEELVAIGRSAGGFTVYGGTSEVIEAVKENSHYSLVVLGDLFLDKGAETRKRQTRELGLTIRERLKADVITADELESRFLFGKKQALKAVLYAAVVVCLYALVFHFQDPILNFLGGETHAKWKWLASISVVLFVPLVAYTYSTVTGLVLKLIDID